MDGLTQKELIEILDRTNPGSRIIKADLHKAVATAIEENNKKIAESILARNRLEIKRQVQQHVQRHIQTHHR